MGWVRGLGRLLGGGLLVLLLVPSLAAWPSALLDRGPDGSVRASAFPLALAVLDPFVWTCARNSVLVASATTVGSLIIGVGLGSIAASGRSWLLAPLRSLLMAPLLAGPVLIAPGIAWMLGGSEGWLEGRSALGVPADAAVRWAALVWTGLVCGVPLVALATLAGLRRVEPSWADAALAVGASRRQVWREVVWPNLRPGVARALALVFTLTLVEPAGPLILGLGRTLAVQTVRAATRLDQPTRASTLALLATAIVLAARSAIGWWGGKDHSRSERPEFFPAPSANPRRDWALRLLLAGWCALAIGPVVLWLRRVFQTGMGSVPSPIFGWLADAEMRTWVVNSAMTAALAVAVDLALLRLLGTRRPGRDGRPIRLACRVFESIPPLALGVWALATPWLILGLADSVEGPSSTGFRWLALELSPGRSPGILLVVVLAGVQLPMLAGMAGLAGALIRPNLADAARLMGESDRRASRAGQGGWFGVVPSPPAFLAFSMAATSLAPALLLTPYSERRTLAPAILAMILGTGPVDPRAVGLILLLIGLNVMASLTLVASTLRTRAGSGWSAAERPLAWAGGR